jgi:hypothetical protein
LAGGGLGYLAGRLVEVPAGYGSGPGWGAAVGGLACAWAANLLIAYRSRRPTRPTGLEHRDGGGPA